MLFYKATGGPIFKKTNFPRRRGSQIFAWGGGMKISHRDLLLHPSPTLTLRTQVYQQNRSEEKVCFVYVW